MTLFEQWSLALSAIAIAVSFALSLLAYVNSRKALVHSQEAAIPRLTLGTSTSLYSRGHVIDLVPFGDGKSPKPVCLTRIDLHLSNPSQRPNTVVQLSWEVEGYKWEFQDPIHRVYVFGWGRDEVPLRMFADSAAKPKIYWCQEIEDWKGGSLPIESGGHRTIYANIQVNADPPQRASLAVSVRAKDIFGTELTAAMQIPPEEVRFPDWFGDSATGPVVKSNT